MMNGIEKRILDKMAKSLVINRSELYATMEAKSKKEKIAVENTVKTLVDKGLITPVYSSQTTFAITQSGLRTASGTSKKQFH